MAVPRAAPWASRLGRGRLGERGVAEHRRREGGSLGPCLEDLDPLPQGAELGVSDDGQQPEAACHDRILDDQEQQNCQEQAERRHLHVTPRNADVATVPRRFCGETAVAG